MRTSLIASFILKLESILVLGLALYMIALGFTHDKSWMPYLSVIGFAIAGSVGLAVVAKGLHNKKRWANSPALLANLIALGVAKYQFEANVFWLAIPISIMALTLIATIILNVKKQGAL